ncbi:hypothetical protein GGTG_09563 [Gaeumannomyces tritici R3-111a-1]|uniref:Uncharacterized protein n=1 Tax=Gaeumannomyces tritici (strain R3-111a-1) TaxID=644352 RepID=J3P7S1_GAET3|nr:hypothetical protein GGTG_09563 [Gaeumannomyces tritici R3-111a-1]EJT72704.1 hypothetical protein GGTG_09563 [Gaeumannomyces tritici R3-111a-1]
MVGMYQPASIRLQGWDQTGGWREWIGCRVRVVRTVRFAGDPLVVQWRAAVAHWAVGAGLSAEAEIQSASQDAAAQAVSAAQFGRIRHSGQPVDGESMASSANRAGRVERRLGWPGT